MKKKYVWFFLLLLAAAVAVGFRSEVAGFLRRNFTATFSEVLPSDPAKLRALYLKKHPKELNIAVFGPWSYYAKQGFILDKAIQLAVDEVNASGGILGRKVNPVWVDNENYSAVAQEQAEKLAADPSVFAVIGPVTSGRVLQFNSLFGDAGMPEVAPLAQSERINRENTNALLFMPIASDLDESRALAAWAQGGGRNNFLILNDDSRFPMSYGSCVEQSFYEKDLLVYGRVLFDQSSRKNYIRDQVLQYLDYFPVQNIIYLSKTGDASDYADLAGRIFARLPEGTLYFNEFTTFDRLLKIRLDRNRVFVPAAIPLNAANRAELRKFLKIEGYERDFLSLIAYRGVHIFADAVRQAGSLDPRRIAETMRTGVMKTPLGEFRFSAGGFEAGPPLEILSLEELEKRWRAIAAD